MHKRKNKFSFLKLISFNFEIKFKLLSIVMNKDFFCAKSIMNKILSEISQPNLIETFHFFLYFHLLFGGDLTGLKEETRID